MVRYIFSRYHVRSIAEHATLAEAIENAFRDMEFGSAWPLCVEDDGGRVLLDEGALHDEVDKLRAGRVEA